VAGYPGGARLTMSLSRTVQPPRGDILLFGPDTGSDPGTVTRPGEPYPLGPAPSYQAPAWLSPTRWVVFAHDGLRTYRAGCVEAAPPRVVGPARPLDVEGYVDEGAWPLVPVDSHSVLAMPSIAAAVRAKQLDASATTEFGARPRPYVSVDTRSGATTATRYVYSGSDAWFAVRPDTPYRPPAAGRRCR
jgi:hypothetical protein